MRIAIVNDLLLATEALRRLLTGDGRHTVAWIAHDGEEAVARCAEDRPDLILMDVVMPGLNGYQATRTLTRDEATKHIPIIVCTSKGQETDRIWGLRQGALDYIVKPVNGEDLLSKIAAL